MKKATQKSKALVKTEPEEAFQLNEAEQAFALALSHARSARLRPPKVTLEKQDGALVISYGGLEPEAGELRLHSTTGLKHHRAVTFLVSQLLKFYEDDSAKLEASRLNRALAMLDELEPKGAAEAMLAAQMVAVSETAMNCLARASLNSQSFAGRELNLKFASKLTRIYTQQMETLAKYRRGGQQKVTVEHVHVHDGGQAIVGNVQHGVGGNAKS